MLLASVAIVAEVWWQQWRGANCEVLLSAAAKCEINRQDVILKQT